METHMPMEMTMGPMMGWAWLILWSVFLAVLIVGVVFLIRSLGDRGRSGSGGSAFSALQILEERFAHGEIDRDEFEERRKILGS
jgi:putative membrane protein